MENTGTAEKVVDEVAERATAAGVAHPIYEDPNAGEKQTAAVLVKQDFRAVHEAILLRVPNGRARSIALTHLETAAMWAVKGIHQAS